MNFIGWFKDYLNQESADFSDIYLKIGMKPIVKTKGMKLVRLDNAPTLKEEDLAWVAERKTIDWASIVDIDHGISIADTRFRVNVYRSMGSGGSVLRRLETDPPALDSLGLPTATIMKTLMSGSGLIFETGETGSGKSTSMAAMMYERAKLESTTTITIEDPVEIVFPSEIATLDGGISQFIQRQVGEDTRSFATGLRAALREAPNVITVGEIRDSETARLAIQAAETGHLVLGTLHTNSAAETITRLLNFFNPEEHAMVRNQLASILKMVIRQALLPTTDGNNRALAYEIMVQTPGISSIIRNPNFNTAQLQNELRSGRQYGMVSLNESLAELVREDRVTPDDALRNTYDLEDLKDKLG